MHPELRRNILRLQMITIVRDTIVLQEIHLLGKKAGTVSHWSSDARDIFTTFLHDFVPADGCLIPASRNVAIDFKHNEWQTRDMHGVLSDALTNAAEVQDPQG